MPKKFNSKEFAKDMAKMIEGKLNDFEVKMDKKIESVPKLTIPANQEILLKASFRGGRKEDGKAILEELRELMLKYGITEIIHAKNHKVE